MIKLLFKARLSYLFASLFRTTQSKNSRTKTILFGLLFLYCFASFLALYGMFFAQICRPFYDAGLAWFYFALAGMVVICLSFVGSVFMAKSQLYEAKDNDLLLSMPIPPRAILVSRIALVFILNVFFSSFITIPCGLVYLYQCPVSALGVIIFIICFAFLPLFPTTLSCLGGWGVAAISRRMKNKTLITVALSLLFLGVYIYVYSSIGKYINIILEQSGQIADAVRKGFYPLYALGDAIVAHNIISFALFLVFNILPFVLLVLLMSRSFLKITSAGSISHNKVYNAGTAKAQKVKRPLAALIVKEMTHFFGSAMYLLNAGLSAIMQIIFSVMLIFKPGIVNTIVEIPGIEKQDLVFICAGLFCMIYCMSLVSAPSISLEGRSLWIIKSSPVSTFTLLLSKALPAIIMFTPAILISAVISGFALKADLFGFLILFLLPASMNVLASFIGVAVNLRLPKFDWISETVCVKQSASVIVTMFCAIALFALPAILYFKFFAEYVPLGIYELAVCGFFAALSALLLLDLKKAGSAIFDRISG